VVVYSAGFDSVVQLEDWAIEAAWGGTSRAKRDGVAKRGRTAGAP